MTVKVTTNPITTDNITVMSHVTSLTAVGNHISKLESSQENSTTIHLNFEVKGKKEEPCILAAAEELELIFNAQDALKLGLLLVEMAANRAELPQLLQEMRKNSESEPSLTA